MGGTAFLIWGKVADLRLEPTPIERTFLDRVLGRQRFQKPQVTQGPDGARIIEAPPDRFRVLDGQFRDFLGKRMAEPWASSKVILDYLRDDVTTLYLRGEQRPDRSDPQWYIQLTFSGCAGLTETSAEVAAHWAAIWFREERDYLVERILSPSGFMVDDDKTEIETHSAFVPVDKLGYGLYVGGSGFEPDPEWPGSRLFELDAGVTEMDPADDDLSALRELDRLYGPLMSDGRCRCQLCAPEFVALSGAELGLKR
jgi:hypothetical protein